MKFEGLIDAAAAFISAILVAWLVAWVVGAQSHDMRLIKAKLQSCYAALDAGSER